MSENYYLGVTANPAERKDSVMVTFSGSRGVETFRAISLKHGLKLFAKTGMIPNRAWTKSNMLSAAGDITGEAYRPRARDSVVRAIADLDRWIASEGASEGELEAEDNPRMAERQCGSARDLDRDLGDTYAVRTYGPDRFED